MDERSMAEPMLVMALRKYIAKGHTNERQLAQLCVSLLELAGDQPNVKAFIDSEAVRVLDEGEPNG